MHSLHTMLAHDNPRLQEIHPRQWIKAISPYTSLSFANGLQVFTLRREALLITLGSLSIAEWGREGHIAGKPHTVFSQMRRMVLHEQTHCDEVDALLRGG